MPTQNTDRLFPALLKYWRGKRGLSQLDLAVAAEVSSRHVSFLETGRSVPSAAMIVRLSAALDVPLRHVNSMLRSAGLDPIFPEPDDGIPESVAQILELMKEHHEPYPMMVINAKYDVLDANQGAAMLFSAVAPEFSEPGSSLNLARLSFDERVANQIVNFDEVGRSLLWRLQREALAEPEDSELNDLLEELVAAPTVDPGWREVDLTVASSPAVVAQLRVAGLNLRFLSMVTKIQAPQSVVLDELRVETWFPVDEETIKAWAALVESQQQSGSDS